MDRHRESSWVETYSANAGSNYPNYPSSTVWSVNMNQTYWMNDVVTPDFCILSSKGFIIVNPMESVRCNRDLYPATFVKSRQRPGYPRYTYHRSHFSPWKDLSPWSEASVQDEVTRLEGLAITEAYAKVQQSQVSSLVELGELHKTLAFLWSPVREILKYTHKAKSYLRSCDRIRKVNANRRKRWNRLPPSKRAGKRPPKDLKLPKIRLKGKLVVDIPSLWLAYRYALMPLIYTVDDISSALTETVKPTRVRARSKEEGVIDLGDDPGWTAYHYEDGWTRERERRAGQVELTVRAGVLYLPDWSLNKTWGWSLERVIPALYELTPLSFVADWFWNAASFYDALTATCRAQKILGSWVTSRADYDVKGYHDAVPDDSFTTVSMSPEGLTHIYGTWTRRRITSLADIRMMLRVKLNTKRYADAFALVANFLKRR